MKEILTCNKTYKEECQLNDLTGRKITVALHMQRESRLRVNNLTFLSICYQSQRFELWVQKWVLKLCGIVGKNFHEPSFARSTRKESSKDDFSYEGDIFGPTSKIEGEISQRMTFMPSPSTLPLLDVHLENSTGAQYVVSETEKLNCISILHN